MSGLSACPLSKLQTSEKTCTETLVHSLLLHKVASTHLGNVLNTHHTFGVLKAIPSSPLPACSSKPANTTFVELTGRGRLVTAQSEDQGSDIFGFHHLHFFLGSDCASHVGAGDGCDGVDDDVVFGSLAGDGLREADNAAFLNTCISSDIDGGSDECLQLQHSWLVRNYRRRLTCW